MRLFVSIVALALALVTAACGSTEATTTTIPPGDSPGNTAEIYATALRQLVIDDNTFGGGGNPFSEFLVLAMTDPGAGAVNDGSAQGNRPLSDEERAAIEAALTPIAPMRWIEDAAEWRTEDLMPVVEGSAILGVGPITFDDDGALVPMSMWCGGLCGTWFTYRMVDTDQGWVVSGIEGPIAVS